MSILQVIFWDIVDKSISIVYNKGEKRGGKDVYFFRRTSFKSFKFL